MTQSDTHLDAARKRLCHLAGLRARTEAAGKAIHSAASDQLDQLQQDLPRLAKRVHTDSAAAEAYQQGTLNVGRLRTILGHGA